MTAIVTMPGVTETYKRAIYEVISPFFDGDEHEVNCDDFEFPEVELVFDIRRLQVPRPLPVICFSGFTDRSGSRYKTCDTKDGCSDRPIYEYRCNSACIVTVASATEVEDIEKSKRAIDRIFDLLATLFKTEVKAFSSRGVFNTHLTCLAVERPDLEYAVVNGRLTSELRYTYAVSIA